ncbi:MAG: pantoate--beta-alanine ligase [Planctomycetota bacterium]|nr:pantoate--beta-alanine ligase [Planctomycetota bacterium]
MQLLRSNAELAQWRAQHAGPIGFVPTMGALHAGHAALVGVASAWSATIDARVLVSVFVNPTQFNEKADFDRYPKTLDADVALCAAAGAAAVYAPTPSDIYPPGVDVRVPALPPVASSPMLEDAHRPGHFAGVAQVVLRLFELTRPDAAFFGEKDWQQLALVRAMTRAEMPSVEIVGVPTVREADGLAMSSRNVFLTPTDRVRALAISAALREADAAATPAEAEAIMNSVLAMAEITPEYSVVRDAQTLGPVQVGQAARALIAARVGSVRLIDNAAWHSA